MNEWLEKYPWTKVEDNRVEPWRIIGSSWLEDLEEYAPGWLNITHAMCSAVQDVIDKLDGIKCGFKSTSCPDQLSKALQNYKA